MKLAVIVGLLLGLVAEARADERVQVDASILTASSSESVESAARYGYGVSLAAWNGRVAGILEAGEHDWAWDGEMRWVGAGARFALFGDGGRVCDPKRTDRCARIRPWLDLGVARESWLLEEPDTTVRGTRYRAHAGFGTDFTFHDRFPLGMSVYFRVNRGQIADFVTADMDVDAPYETNMVIGAGLFFIAGR